MLIKSRQRRRDRNQESNNSVPYSVHSKKERNSKYNLLKPAGFFVPVQNRERNSERNYRLALARAYYRHVTGENPENRN
jgi:hypothetical protein